jgi:hypothetical protein
LRKNINSATGALKGRGFKPRLTSFSKTYGTAEKPCPFKTPTLGIFPRFSAAINRISNELGLFIPCSAKMRFYAAGPDREKAIRVMVFLQAYRR